MLATHSPLNRRTASLATAALVLAASLSACQTQPTQPAVHERSVLLQRMDTLVQGAQPTVGVRLLTQPDPVATGQTLAVEVGTSQAGYLYLYQVATDGRTLSIVFPNAMDGANYVTPGVTRLPRASWQLKAHGPAGVGYLVAVLTQQPLNLLQLQADVEQGQFSATRPYGAAISTLREVAPR